MGFMEYKLNKIDMELREKVNEATSACKIHTKENIGTANSNAGNHSSNEKYGNGSKQYNSEDNFRKIKDEPKRKRIFVEASKDKNFEVQKFEVQASLDGKNINTLDYRGKIIDVKK